MANVMSVIGFVTGMVVMQTCIVVWIATFLSKPVERARLRLESKPGRCMLAGLVCLGITLVAFCGYLLVRVRVNELISGGIDDLFAWLSVNRIEGDARVMTYVGGWLLFGPVMVAAVIGSAAFSELFAERVRHRFGCDSSLMALTMGAFCTSASCFLPFAGWFVFLPVIGLMSIGAGFWGVLGRSV